MKYLLCRPCGGLNDNLYGIQSCIDYSKKYNRILLIDTNYNNVYKFNFCDVFQIINHKNIIYDSNKIKEIIINKKLTIFPNEINDLYDYSIEYRNNYGFCLKDTYIKTFISTNKDYIEDIILYNNCGGGDIKIMKYLKLTEYYINDIINKYNQIPKPYLSIQIRNTDRKCNYKSVYEKNKEKIEKSNIFFATDSIEALNYFKSLNLKIFSFTKLPDIICRNYHYCNKDKKEILLNTISDLFLLGLGNDFIFSEENKSGYYRLAYFLYQNKDILQNVIRNKLLVKPKISLFKKR